MLLEQIWRAKNMPLVAGCLALVQIMFEWLVTRSSRRGTGIENRTIQYMRPIENCEGLQFWRFLQKKRYGKVVFEPYLSSLSSRLTSLCYFF